MRFLFSLSAAVVLGIVTLAACNSGEKRGNRSSGNTVSNFPAATPAHVAPSDGVKRITTIELRDALQNGTAIVIDVRGDDPYKQNHIKGSISIPFAQIQSRLSELPRDKMIVTYCS